MGIFSRLFSRKAKAPTAPEQKPEADKPATGFFSTTQAMQIRNVAEWIARHAFQKTAADFAPVTREGVAMDDNTTTNFSTLKGAFTLGQAGIIPQNLFAWYVSQGFIGYQACAIIAQHWLVDKACSVAPQDAARKGYEITANSGEAVPVEALDALKAIDKRHNIQRQLVEFARFNRVFGIRIALFQVDSADQDYYTNPFNPDGVTPGSYKGISQVDPYWITPELDADAAANPASRHFYEPTYWRIMGKRYHRSHLVIIRAADVADVLKPSYVYGGLPLTQRIFERVYAAERTANEAPLLALTKRTTVLKTDMDAVVGDQEKFENKLALWIHYRDNHGVKVCGTGEELDQIETSLADLDAVIMTQYQLVAAIANTPASKLIKTQPKGFSSNGEYDESDYHEYLETIQVQEMQPLLERHHLLAIRSELAEEYGVFQTEIAWRPLDSMTETEVADVRLKNAQADQVLQITGAINGTDIRRRLITDKFSGYNGLEAAEDYDMDPEAAPGNVLPVPGAAPTVPTSIATGAPPAAIDAPPESANQTITNLTGKQFQGLERILRKVAAGTLTEAQGVMMLQQAYGMTAAQASGFMGLEKQDDETPAAV